MADINERTQDVSITDENTGIQAEVVTRYGDNKKALVGDVISNTIAGVWSALGYMFSVTTDIISLGTNSETEFLLLKNPTGSDVEMRLGDIFVASDKNGRYEFHMYREPTVTSNGTSLAPIHLDHNFTSAATVETYKLPTASSFGTKIHVWLLNAYGGEQEKAIGLEYGFVIPAGHSVLFTVKNIINADAIVSVIFAEVPTT